LEGPSSNWRRFASLVWRTGGLSGGRFDEVRRVIYTTNAIGALNRQLRKAIKTKGNFPNEDAARKLIYLALVNAAPQWTRYRNWTTALLAFKIHFGDRSLTLQTDCHTFTATRVTVILTVKPPTQKTGRPPCGVETNLVDLLVPARVLHEEGDLDAVVDV
jgi:hypothetical protein